MVKTGTYKRNASEAPNSIRVAPHLYSAESDIDRLLAALPPASLVCSGHEYTLSNAAFATTVDPHNPALRRRIEDARTMRQTGRPTLPVTLAGEATTNPFLRVDEDALITAVTHRLGRAPADRVETFATLRQWKNDFRA